MMTVSNFIRKEKKRRNKRFKTLAGFVIGAVCVFGFGFIGKSDMEAEAGISYHDAVLVDIEDGFYVLETENGKQYKIQDPPETIFKITLQNGEIVGLEEE